MPSMGDAASPPSRELEPTTSGYIDHPVSRLDTLAGVAIKYGVEVADVKRFNGLTTDLQMFALKTLRIPTPGRHPPSAALTSPSPSRLDERWSGKQKGQDTMELLRAYYGLEGLEIATLSSETDLDDEVLLPMFRPPNAADPPRHFKPNRCGYVRESCNNLLESCWSVPASPEPSRVLRSGTKVAREGHALRPIRRRTRGDDASSSNKDPASKLRSSSSSFPFARLAPTSEWHGSSGGASGTNSIGAAFEGLLFKVMQTSRQDGGRGLAERVPSTGSSSALEGMASAPRQAKAALD